MAKKKKHDADDGPSQGWMLTFCDLVTLLLTFFVMLNSMAVRDDRRVRLALGSLTDTFNKFKGGGFIDKDSKGGRALIGQTMENIRKEMEEVVRKIRVAPDIKLKLKEKKIEMTLKKAILFDPGSSTLSQSSEQVLAKVSEILKRYPLALEIDGYASPAEMKNPQDSDSLWNLSMRRSLSVFHFLNTNGIDSKRLHPYGLGDKPPAADSITSSPLPNRNRVDLDFHVEDLRNFTEFLQNREPSSYYYKGFFFKLFHKAPQN
jgi:chemotaxis protein MotB